MTPEHAPFGGLTYVIAVRLTDAARQRNLEAIVNWVMTRFSGVQVIIVEHDARPRMHVAAGAGEITHVFLEDGGPFDKGWALNCGVRCSTRPYLAIGDADVAVSASQLIAAVGLLETHDAVKPYHRAKVIDLDESETARFAAALDVTGLCGRNWRGLTNFAGGLFLARRDFYLGLGGFPEGFRGWGGEDDAMGLLLERFGRTAELPGPCVHLAHPRGAGAPDNYLANVRRLLAIAGASNEALAAWNLARRERMGDLRRPPPGPRLVPANAEAAPL